MEDINSFADVFEESSDHCYIEESEYSVFLEEVSAVSFGYMQYMEESFSDKIKSMIGQVRIFFSNLIDRFNQFLVEKKVKREIEYLEKILSDKDKQKKVRVVDFKKIEKLHNETMKSLCNAKSEKEVETIMNDHEKKRKGILNHKGKILATAAAILAGCVLIVKTYNKETRNDQNYVEKRMRVEEKADGGRVVEKVIRQSGNQTTKTVSKQAITGTSSKAFSNPAVDLATEKRKVEEARIKAETNQSNNQYNLIGSIAKNAGKLVVQHMTDKRSFIGGAFRTLNKLGGAVDKVGRKVITGTVQGYHALEDKKGNNRRRNH